MVEHLAYVTTNTGLRTPEIEETRQAARVAISELANALKEFAGPTLWKAALRATESWIELLIYDRGIDAPESAQLLQG